LTVVLSLTVEKNFVNYGEHVFEDLLLRVPRLDRVKNFGRGFTDRGGCLAAACGGVAGVVFLDAAASPKLFDALLLVAVFVAGAIFAAEGLTGAAGVADCFARVTAGFCCGLSAAGPDDFFGLITPGELGSSPVARGVSTAAICAFCRVIICFFFHN
jgi:hypothetical protein